MCVSTVFRMKHYERLKVCHVLGLAHSGWSTLTDIHVCTVQLQLLCPSLFSPFIPPSSLSLLPRAKLVNEVCLRASKKMSVLILLLYAIIHVNVHVLVKQQTLTLCFLKH